MAGVLQKVRDIKDRVVSGDSQKKARADKENASHEQSEPNCIDLEDGIEPPYQVPQVNPGAQAYQIGHPQPSKPHTAAFWFFLFWVIVLPVYGVATFLAGLLRRERALAAHPDLEFLTPPVAVIVLHWLFFISATTLVGCGLWLAVSDESEGRWTTKSSDVVFSAFMISLVSTLGFFIAYLIVSCDTTEHGVSKHFASISDFERKQSQFITSQPYASLTGKISSSGGGSCTPLMGGARAVNSTDESHFPNISFTGDGPAVRIVIQSLTVNWTAESLEKIHQMERDLGKCRENDYPNAELSHRDSIEGYVRIGFVGENEAATRGLGFGSGIAWAIFFGGIYYTYSVDAIPVVRMDIRKNDVVVGTISGCLETAWDCGDCG
jgi:hypothetical protein